MPVPLSRAKELDALLIYNDCNGMLRWFVMGIVALLNLSCDFRRGPDPDVPLEGGYVLGSYESVNDDGYFVAQGDQVVVSSSIREIGVVEGKIIGRVEDAMVLAMERIENGYFILDTHTGGLSAGLSKTDLEERMGAGVSTTLLPPRDWKR